MARLSARGSDIVVALARLLSDATGVEIGDDSLRSVLILAGAGLLLSLLLILSGCDLSATSDFIPPA